MFPLWVWRKYSNKIKSGLQYLLHSAVESKLFAVHRVIAMSWFDQNSSLESVVAWNTKNEKGALQFHVVCSITVVASRSVIEEGGGYTPAFGTWDPSPNAHHYHCHLPYYTFLILALTCSTLSAAAWDLVVWHWIWWVGMEPVVTVPVHVCFLHYRLGLSPSSLKRVGLPIIFWAMSFLLYLWVCIERDRQCLFNLEKLLASLSQFL